ncbi:MAG: hypothetical protein WCX17_03670 [Parcubacteria group bacterium]
MKKFVIATVVLAMLLPANFVFACEDDNGDNSHHGDQGKSINAEANININNRTYGDFPYVPGMPGVYPPNYFPGYERQVNDLSSEDIIKTIDNVTEAGFETFKRILIEERGEKFFKRLESSVSFHPDITATFPASKEVRIISKKSMERYDLSMLKKIGTIAADSKLEIEGEFDSLTYRQDLLMFCGQKVLKYGANIIVPDLDSFRAYITPSGTTKGAGASVGFLKALGSLFGITGSAQYETTTQKTVMRGDASVTYQLYHVDDIERFLHPPKETPRPLMVEKPMAVVEKPKPEPEKTFCGWIWEKILEYKQKCVECERWCFNNLENRVVLQKLFIELYVCTGKMHTKYLEEAMENHRIAVDNYTNGGDIKKHQPAADKLMAEADYFHSGCISILKNEGAAIKFAQEKKLERYATDFR